jgi:hypothetical protein
MEINEYNILEINVWKKGWKQGLQAQDFLDKQ